MQAHIYFTPVIFAPALPGGYHSFPHITIKKKNKTDQYLNESALFLSNEYIWPLSLSLKPRDYIISEKNPDFRGLGTNDFFGSYKEHQISPIICQFPDPVGEKLTPFVSRQAVCRTGQPFASPKLSKQDLKPGQPTSPLIFYIGGLGGIRPPISLSGPETAGGAGAVGRRGAEGFCEEKSLPS